MFRDFDFDCDSETPTEGSDKEARCFSTDSESNAEGRQPDRENPQYDATCGTPIREHLFLEQDSGFNLYALFSNPVEHRLAHFFNLAKTYKKKLDQFFNDGILKGLNATHHVQFGAAYTLCKLVDTAASGPYWHKGTMKYPLQKGVPFRYRNIVTAVKYLLRQTAYAADMKWRPDRVYDNQGNRVYSEINAATCWQNTQLSDVLCRI